MKTIHKILFLFLFSLLTHIPGILNPLLDYHGWAQTLRASMARNYYEEGMDFFNPHVDFHGNNSKPSSTEFPLYSYLVALAYKVFGAWDILGRIVSILFAALSAVALYFLAHEFVEENTAFLSGVIFCVIPIRVYFMRTVMPESMAIFFLLAGYWGTARWIKEKDFLPYGFLSAFSLTLSSLLKIPYLFLMLPAFYLILSSENGKYRKAATLLIFFFLGLWGWYSYTLHGTVALSPGDHPFLYETNLPFEWFKEEFWSTQFLSRFPELLTTYSGVLFLSIGLWVAFQQRFGFLFVWFFSTVGYLLFCGKYGIIHQYAALPFAPVNALLIAVGFFYCWNIRLKKASRALLIALLFSMPVHAALRIKHWYRCDEQWVLKAKEVVDEISKPTDLFYVDAKDQPFFLYHLHRKGFVSAYNPYGSPQFEEAIHQGLKFFFLPGKKSPVVTDPQFLKRFNLVYDGPDFVIYRLVSRS